MIFADLELARRLEGLETWVAAEYARARLAIRPETDTAVVSVAGGVACFLGEGSPLNEVRGMGMAGPVTGDDLEAMERVFFDRGTSVKVNVCPMADPSLLESLVSRGYRATSFEDMLYRELDGSEAFLEPSEGMALDWDSGEICGEVMTRGFAAPEEPTPELNDVFAMTKQVEGQSSILARVGGEPAGAAMLLIRDGLAMLCGAATLLDFRNRGIQTALSHARLAHASHAGCGLVMVGAMPGSTSHRNAERLGFRVAYTKLFLLRDPA